MLSAATGEAPMGCDRTYKTIYNYSREGRKDSDVSQARLAAGLGLHLCPLDVVRVGVYLQAGKIKICTRERESTRARTSLYSSAICVPGTYVRSAHARCCTPCGVPEIIGEPLLSGIPGSEPPKGLEHSSKPPRERQRVHSQSPNLLSVSPQKYFAERSNRRGNRCSFT